MQSMENNTEQINGEQVYPTENETSDERHLREMGYEQELYRGFSPFMSFAFCFTSVNVMASISLGFNYILIGGSGTAFWTWIIGAFFTLLIALSMGEICSVYPTAGSVYHWASQLAPERYAPLASFIGGWFNFFGYIAGGTSYASAFAAIIHAALVIDGKQGLSIGAQVGVGIAILFLWSAQSALRIDQQGWLNNLAAFFQISTTIIIVIVLFIMAPQKASAHTVFLSTYNATGFPMVYVYFISILAPLFALSGYDAGAHLAEETRNAGRVAPRGIVGTCVCGAITGLIYILALLFAIPNVDDFMNQYNNANTQINLAVATYDYALTISAAMAMTIFLIVDLYFAGTALITVTSRTCYAMARDGIFPGSSYITWIYGRTKTPLVNILVVLIVDSLLLLLQLASTTALQAILSITTIGFQISYCIPIFFRCTFARKMFPRGQFSLGRVGVPIAAISSIWLFITSLLMFFPSQYPVTVSNMNYTIVIVGGILIVAGIYWMVSARHFFKGPPRVIIKTATSASKLVIEESTLTVSRF